MTTVSGENVIETTDLTKQYGDVVAVDHLTLRVPRGGVFGFLGPNGSGKTTTMGMLLGLVHPTSGDARIFGDPARHPATLRRVGAMVGPNVGDRLLLLLVVLDQLGAQSEPRQRRSQVVGHVGGLPAELGFQLSTRMKKASMKLSAHSIAAVQPGAQHVQLGLAHRALQAELERLRAENERLRRTAASRGMTMPDINKRQAMVPRGAAVLPFQSTWATDSSQLRLHNVQAYGLVPFPLTEEDLKRMHGDDERIPLAAFNKGVDVLARIVAEFAVTR